MHYITLKEMEEIRSVLHLKDRMTRRAYKKTPTERKYINSVGVFTYMLDKFF